MEARKVTENLRILVIEEDPGLRELFRVLFEEDLPMIPGTPRLADRLLTEAYYDLLILDEDSGMLERRWGISARPPVPTLLIAPARPARLLGSSAPSLLVLPKPFAVELLLDFVEAIRAARAAH
jgi:DNA-binding response OmpR family regulator